MEGKESHIFLGRSVDADELYINGQKIGHTTYHYPQRRYSDPENVLPSGKNVFDIKVTNFNGKGGFVPDKPYYLFSETDPVDLKGYWEYKVGEVLKIQEPSAASVRPVIAQNEPTALFNAIHTAFFKRNAMVPR